MNYIVATLKSWNVDAFHKYSKKLDGNWYLINNKRDLNLKTINKISPKYIFFPHWSDIVNEKILNNSECVCFHASDLPFGRGGSPIQNLISLGITKTKLCALKMTSSIDAGPIYLKSPLFLHGRAQDIYNRMSVLTWKMIEKIIKNEIQPKPQKGKVFNFKRKTPEQSKITPKYTLKEIHDKIRMLDAETYPKAYINKNNLKLEFFESSLERNKIIAKVIITKQVNKANK